MFKNVRITLAGLALAAAIPMAQASTTSFTFACFTNNSGQCATYASQFQLDVTSLTPTTVEFKFMNLTNPGFITEIYFDVNNSNLVRLFSLSIPAAQPGVAYTLDSSPTNSRPPGSAPFNWANNGDTDFELNPNNPAPQNGVNTGEQFIVNGVLGAGVTYAQLIASFTGPTTDSRIGMHVQGLPQGFSESMYATVIPVPAALPLMLSGLVGFGLLARRRRNNA